MLRDEYDHQLAPHLALNALSSHAESLAYLPDDLGRAADFQTIGSNGKPLHDRKPFYDVSLKDFLRDNQYTLKETPRQNLRRMLSNSSVSHILKFLYSATFPDAKWNTGHSIEQHQFVTTNRVTDAVFTVVTNFERTHLNPNVRSRLTWLPLLADRLNVTVADVVLFIKHAPVNVSYSSLGGEAATVSNAANNHLIDDIADDHPDVYQAWYEHDLYHLKTIGAYPGEVCIIDRANYTSNNCLLNDNLAIQNLTRIWNNTAVGEEGIGEMYRKQNLHSNPLAMYLAKPHPTGPLADETNSHDSPTGFMLSNKWNNTTISRR